MDPNAILRYLKDQLSEIPVERRGIYVLLDLDAIPLYVGQSATTRDRIQRHLTNHRTDAIGKHMIDAYDIGFLDYWLIDESVNLNDAEAAVAALFPETLNEKQPPAAKRTLTAPPMNRIQLLPSDVIAARRETNARISAMLDNASRLADRINRYKDEQQYRLALKLQIKRIYALMSDAEYARRNVGRVEPQPLPLPPLDLSQVQTERD